MEKIRKDVEELYPHILEIRRQIHRHPEIKLKEYETAALVEKELKKAGIEVHPHYADTTAVIGVIKGSQDGPTRAFRADMDALPIKEETGLPYASEIDGMMHACGHDFHTAILIGTALVLARNSERLKGTVVFVFQPGEEGGFGGKVLVEHGLIEEFSIKYIIGQHLFPETPYGKVGYRAGVMTANSDRFEITVKGRGGHGARPEQTVDPISIAAHISTAFASIHSRELSPHNPTVITIGSITAGMASNVIPDTATIKGTVRTFGEENRKFTLNRVKEVSEGIAKTFRGEASVNIALGYPSVVNDCAITQKLKEAASEYLGSENVVELEHPSMGGEDFAYYAQKIPATFYRLGVGPSYPLHNARFAPKEDVLKIGMGINSTIALLKP